MKETITITEEENGKRIDAICAKRFPKISRSQWSHYGQFYYENEKKAVKTKARKDQEWVISYESEAVDLSVIVPWKTKLTVLAETENWVAIYKPKGMSVHPSSSEKNGETLVNALVYKFGKDLSVNFDEIEGKQIARPGIVHRLDKTTSGVILVAKNNEFHTFIQEQWKDVRKFYWAMVQGKSSIKGRIKSGIDRDPYLRNRMTVVPEGHGKLAHTEFERMETEMNRSLLWVEIFTGRTHQIRVHLSSIGFPIVGDELYGGPEDSEIHLQANRLEFTDMDGQKIVVEVPKPKWAEGFLVENKG